MDIGKYTIPNLPAPQYILEDLSDPNIIKNEPTLNITHADGILQESYACYKYFKVLQNDLEKQDELNLKLEELDKKLLENIQDINNQL